MQTRLGILVFISWLMVSCSLETIPQESQATTRNSPTSTASSDKDDQNLNGAIAYIGAEGDIYLVQEIGAPPNNLTADANISPESDEDLIFYREPTWSPNGSELAFVRRLIPPQGEPDARLEVYDLNSQSMTTVLSSEQYVPFYLYWSPDGKKISFLTTGDGVALNLWVTGADSQARILDQGQPYYWTWMADGENLLAHVGGSVDANPDNARLQFVATAQSTPVSVELSPLDFQAPVITKMGDQILVVGRQAPDSDGLYLLTLEGEVIEKIDEIEGRVAFDFSPSGRYLAYVSGPEVEGVHIGRLVVIDLLDPQGPRQLTPVNESVAAFWWSPTEDRLLYFEPTLVPETFTQPVSLRSQDDASLRLRGHIYETGKEEAYPLVTFMPTQEFFRILPYYDQYQRSATIWSPDGRYIVYPAALSDRPPGIFILNVSGDSPPIQVGVGILAFWSFR
jgi:TolB protein